MTSDPQCGHDQDQWGISQEFSITQSLILILQYSTVSDCLWQGQLITKRSVDIHIDFKDSTWIHTQNDLSQGWMMLLLRKNFNKFCSVKQTEHEQQILWEIHKTWCQMSKYCNKHPPWKWLHLKERQIWGWCPVHHRTGEQPSRRSSQESLFLCYF